MAGESDHQGVMARVSAALRYIATGKPVDGWFGPMDPLPPQAPDDVKGRQYDYQTAININMRPRGTEPIGFQGLKVLATHPLVAMLIQRQISKVVAMSWQVKPRVSEENRLADDPEIKAITDFLRYPDQEHDWGQWLGAILNQLLVIDAVTIYGAPNRRGGLYALQVLDGASIKPIIDLGGRRPAAPSPAYQQVLKGMPAVNYTADELIYFPETYRADRLYGYSRVEQARDMIETAISRLRSQKGFFDYGNVGDGFFTGPESWTPDMTKALEEAWNAMMTGDPALRRKAPFLPTGSEWHPTKAGILEDDYDAFLIRLLCFPFGVSAQPFMKQTGLGNSGNKTDHDAADEGGIAPLMQYVERLMGMILAKWFGRADLEFSYSQDREFDPQIAALIDDSRLKNGTATINKILDRTGEPPIEGGDVPLLYAGSTWVTLDSVLNPPKPPAPVVAAPVAPNAAPGDVGAPTAPVPPLAKSLDVSHLGIVLTSYFAMKGAKVAEVVSSNLAKAASDDPSARVGSALSDAGWNWDDLPPLVEPIIAGVAVAAGTSAVSSLGLFDAETLKRVSARAVAYAQDRGAEMVGMKWIDGALVDNPDAEWSIAATTRDMLQKMLVKTLEDGSTGQQLAKQIVESAAFSAERAQTIARSETAVARIQGNIAGWVESGVVGGMEFVASPDCCEDCQDEDGTIVPLADAPDGNDTLLHPNCRCNWVAVQIDDMPTGEEAATED